MRRRACRVAHVVQAVEEGDEIEILLRIIFCRSDREPGISNDPVLTCMRLGVLDRARVEIVTDKLGVRKSGRHDYGGHAVAAPDIGHPGSALELFDDAIERGEPLTYQVIVVTGAEELRNRTKQTARLITPSHAVARFERREHLRVVLEKRCHTCERPGHVNGTILYSENHGLFRR